MSRQRHGSPQTPRAPEHTANARPFAETVRGPCLPVRRTLSQLLRRVAVLTSIRVRLTLWYVAVLALVLALCSGAIYVTEQQSLFSQLDNQLNARLRQVSGTYDARSGRLVGAAGAATAQGDEIALLLTPTGQVMQTQAAGAVSTVKGSWDSVVLVLRAVAQSRNTRVLDLGLLLTSPAVGAKAGLLPAATARPAIYRLTGMTLTAHQQVAALLVVGIRSTVPQQLADLLHTLETVVPLILLFCAAGGYWLADRALRPVRTITRTAQSISATDLSRRLNLHRRDELGQLGATFDRMLERLQAAFERQHRFTADASHELRTPLTIIDLEATRALARPRTGEEYRQAITIMQEETHHLTRLVNDLLTLARTESGEATLQRMEVNLAEVVLDVVERLLPLAEQRGMALTIDALPDLPVWGDQRALTRMLTNVVENAVKYGASSGTQVRISGGHEPESDSARAWLQITDDGPGIAVEHLQHMGERFYRAEPSRTHVPNMSVEQEATSARLAGSGLGLAISQGIVDDHGGTLRISSGDGQGVVVDIWLPVCGASRA